MAVKVDKIKLGELIHRSIYNYIFTRDQTNLGKSVIDKNQAGDTGRLRVNNSAYGALVEIIRQDIFLPNYGFSDQFFNEMGWQQVRGVKGERYKKGLFEGEETKIDLNLYIEPRIYFHMVFDFFNSKKEIAATIVTNDCWNKKTDRGIWILHRGPIPEFFIKSIKNV